MLLVSFDLCVALVNLEVFLADSALSLQNIKLSFTIFLVFCEEAFKNVNLMVQFCVFWLYLLV